jgi:hypothetical protein
MKLRLSLLFVIATLFASSALACETCKRDVLGYLCWSTSSYGSEWCYEEGGNCFLGGNACCTTCRSAVTSGDETAGPVAEGVLKSAVADRGEELPLGGFTLQRVESAVVARAD